jgi:hydroxymethylglutaryl-CoA lyase
MKDIKIHSVGLRDGLQMEKEVVPFDIKIKWIEKLYQSNVHIIQVGSFVHKEKMPQMADTDDLFKYLNSTKPENTVLSGLVLNEKGLERALDCNVEMICLGVSASETHSQKNTRMTVDDATNRIITMAKQVLSGGRKLQVSVQSAFGCGFEGDISEDKVYSIVDKYLNVGIKNISLADTAGFANPEKVERMFSKILSMDSSIEAACHFHNTYGMGIANCYAAYKTGVKYFESAFGGLGGCPFTKKASGNVATEDLVEMFNNFGIIKEINLNSLIELAKMVSEHFNRELPGYVYKTGSIKH